MKISKPLFLLCSFLLCFLTVASDQIKGDDKIKLQIELLNKDNLLSSPHLKTKKSIMHNGKKINIKLFEKIKENVLERAYIVEEIDKTKSLNKDQKHELLTLKNEDTEEDDTEADKDEIDFEDENTDDGQIKVISTEESKENDIHMIRKVYKQTKGNKEITYCYMIFTFNLDLEKMNETSKSELFKSLDSMPNYLSFLSPDEKISETENLLEEEYEKSTDDSVKNSRLGGISTVELSHKSEEIEVNILKYIRTLDNIINYFINQSENSSERPAFFTTLLKERAYLYKLSMEKEENEKAINEGYWENKSKIEKYVLYEVLSKLNKIYFTGMIKKTYNRELDNSTEHEKFIDLIEKSIQCHSLLDNTEILDVMILQKLDISKVQTNNENKKDKKLIEQCFSLYKLLLNENDEDTVGKKYETSLMNNNETKNALNQISDESFPIDNYMLRKEISDIDDIIKPIENSSSKLEDDEENSDLIDSDESEVEENDVEDLYDEIESDMEKEKEEKKYDSFLQKDNEVITSDISTEMFNEYPEISKETEKEHKNEILDVVHSEEQRNLDDDINSPIEKDIKPHNEMSSSYLENTSLLKDDDDEEDEFEDDEVDVEDENDEVDVEDENDEVDVEDENDEVDVEDENDEVDEEDENEDMFSLDDDSDMFSDEDNIEEDDDDHDDNSDDNIFGDNSNEDDFDLDEEDNEDGNNKFTNKIKKTFKKGFKNVLNTGKEMGKKALNNLIDKAEGQVQKLTNKLTKKAKDKLNGKKKSKNSKNSKNSKKSKKSKKNKEKPKEKAVKKTVKKTKSNGNKKNKKNEKKVVKSNEESLRNASKTKPKDKKKKPASSSSMAKSKKNEKLRKPNKKGAFIGLTSDTSKLSSNSDLKKTLSKVSSKMAALRYKKVQLLKDLEKPTISDEQIMEDFNNYEENLKNKRGAHIRKL